MNVNLQLTSRSPKPPPGTAVMALVFHALFFAVFISSGPAAHSLTSTNVSSPEHWQPPIPGANEADVLRPFIPPQLPWSSAHRGIDIQAPSEQVVAPADGEVTFVGTVVDRSVMTIQHPNGLLSSFEPVESDLEVGDKVTAGEVLGTLSTETQHCATRCVHWGVRKPDAWQVGSSVRDLYLDPAFLLGWSEPSVLWPLHADPSH